MTRHLSQTTLPSLVCRMTTPDGRTVTVKTDPGLTERQAIFQGIARASDRLREKS
jgi:hypothetical protein